MTGQLLQFGGSLLAIFAVAWLVHRLRLGGDKRIRDEDHARDLAGEVVDGFDPVEIALDIEGRAALLRDKKDQIMMLKMHGSKAAGRILGPAASAKPWQDLQHTGVMVYSGEHWFGNVDLQMDNAQAWAQTINAIDESAHA